MLTVTPFSVKKDANKNHILPAKEEKEEVCHSLLDEDGEPHSEDQKHRDKCNICQSKVRHRDAMTNELCYVCIDTLKNQPFATIGHFDLVTLAGCEAHCGDGYIAGSLLLRQGLHSDQVQVGGRARGWNILG